MPPKPSIEKWVKEHMAFWYDMSKPVDVYSQNFNNWQNYNPNAVSITNNKIIVNDLIDNFRIASTGKETESFSVFIEGLGDKNLVYRVKLDESSNEITNIKLKDGENILPKSFATTVAFMGTSGVTDYIGLTITQLPSGQSVPTNEILKANPYLQDFSGNNRPLKLNNFLFAAMSGVGGYEYFSEDVTKTSANKYETIIGNITNINKPIRFSVHGLTELNTIDKNRGIVRIYSTGNELFKVSADGIYSFTVPSEYTSFSLQFGGGQSAAIPCNVVISPIPLYPNALVTDGVDDYGQVQNLQQGVKVLFYTCNPFSLNKVFYDQRKVTSINESFFNIYIYNENNKIAYNSRNIGGVTYIDGTLNDSLLANDLLNTKHIITIVNDGADENNTISPIYFSTKLHNDYFANLAFYGSIGFDSIPTKETDGFTEQELITWVIDTMINGTPQSEAFPYVFPLKVS